MIGFRKTWLWALVPVGAVGGPTLDRWVCPLVAAADAEAAAETVTVSPTGPTAIRLHKQQGDVDNRLARPDRDGLMLVGPGDSVKLYVRPPAELVGKRVRASIEYELIEESSRNCKKVVTHHQRSLPVASDPEVAIGRPLRIELLLESLIDGSVIDRRELTAGENRPFEVKVGGRLRVRFKMDEELVEFDGRTHLTAQEHAELIDPNVQVLRGNPQVRFKSPLLAGVSVQPGTVADVAVELRAVRSRR